MKIMTTMPNPSSPSHLTGLPLILATIAVSLSTFMVVLDYSVANVALPYIAGDLAVSSDQGIYVITSFAVGSAVCLPVTGWLTKRFGLVRLNVIAMLLFCLLSWICGISPSIFILVIARFLQGIAAGPLIPTSQTLILSMFPPEKKNAALAFWTTVAVVGPVVGPILGGWISYDYSWPWIFFMNIPVCFFAACLTYFFLKKYETPRKKEPLDWIGLILLTIAVASLQFLLDKGQQFDWWRSPIIITCSIACVVCFTYLFAWQRCCCYPLIDFSLFKFKTYTLSIVYVFFVYAIYFGIVVIIPLWLQEYMGYTAPIAGWAVAPLGIFPLLFSSAVAKFVSKVGAVIPLCCSLFCFSATSFLSAFFFDTDINFGYVALSRLLVGIGILFFFIPLFNIMVREIPLAKLPSGAGFFHFVRAMSGGIGTSIFTTLWARRTIFHHFNLISKMHQGRPAVNTFFNTLHSQNLNSEQSLAIGNNLVDKQAAVLALNDSFFLMGWIFIMLMSIIFLAKEKKKTPIYETHLH